ncbi:MAG: glycosyltransferase family 4 protein [Ignavibacteria bacterium]|nr:glycosyltransferase family 4 protein [Ignavibacteria bacterium]
MKVILVDSLIGNDYTLCLASSLQNEGLDIIFIVPANRKFNNENNFIIKRWSPSKDRKDSKLLKLFKYFEYLFKLFVFIINNRDTVIHFQFFRFKFDILFFIFLRFFNVKLVHTAHDVLPHETKKIDYLLNYFLYKASRKIIVHSSYIKNKLISIFNINQGKIEIVPHGNFDIYKSSSPISIEEAKKELNLSPADKVILFFGFIREYKGLDILLDSYSLVHQKNPEIKFIIAGAIASKSLTQLYEKKISTFQKDGSLITIFNYIPSDKVATYFTAADFVVLPYKDIDHSGIVHLAYSFEIPIIATNVGDFSETIEEGKSGYLVEKNDPNALADTIIEAFNNDELKLNMKNYINELNKNKYSWDNIARKTIEVYKEVKK